MTIYIKAHFDGHVIIPDEPVNLPVNQPLIVDVSVDSVDHITQSKADAAFERLLEMGDPNSNIPPEALRRENMYEDR